MRGDSAFAPRGGARPILQMRRPLSGGAGFPRIPTLFRGLGCPRVSCVRRPSPSSNRRGRRVPRHCRVAKCMRQDGPRQTANIAFSSVSVVRGTVTSSRLARTRRRRTQRAFRGLRNAGVREMLRTDILKDDSGLGHCVHLCMSQNRPRLLAKGGESSVLQRFSVARRIPRWGEADGRCRAML